MTRITLIYGGSMLDVDEQTSVGFSYESDWLFDKKGGKGRSFDLTVPATLTNTKIFSFDREPVMVGVRQSTRGTVIMSGVSLEGVFFLTEYGGERYSLLFVYGKEGELFDIKGGPNVFPNIITIDSKEVPTLTGLIWPFGYYNYNNGTTEGTVGSPVTLFPMANLGYVIDTMAASIGWTVNYPDVALGRAYQAEAYGFTLPTMEVFEQYGLAISGSGRNGWIVVEDNGYSLANAGLHIITRRYKRGDFNENVTVYAFEATKPIRVVLPPNSGAVIASGVGYDVKNEGGHAYLYQYDGTGGCDFNMETGEWFTIVSPADCHLAMGGRQRWNGSLANPKGYTTNVNVHIDVYNDGDEVSEGDILQMGLNLPDMTLREYLEAYCNIICACWKPDNATKTIDILPLDDLLNNVTDYLPLDDMRVLGIDSVKRYIDGWSRHNLTVCKSEDYVTEECRFMRDAQSENDYLDDEREVAVIPFNEGNYRVGSDMAKLAVFEDVVTNENNSVDYKGAASIVFENFVNSEGALHIQSVVDLGVGSRYGSFTRQAATVKLRVAMPFRIFAALDNTKGATFRGQQYVVASAQWGDGIATLELLTLEKDSAEEATDISKTLNFTMKDGGTVTLTRTGNPVAVTLEISTDNGFSWEEWQEVGNERTLTLNAGQRVFVRNASDISTGFSVDGDNHYRFSFDSPVNAAGAVETLLCKRADDGVITPYCFYGLFYGCADLKKAPDIISKTLDVNSLRFMFRECTSLLESAKMDVTTLAEDCCRAMYRGCTSLVKASELLATSSVARCYHQMFFGCTSLANVTVYLDEASALNCLYQWLYNVASSGDFYKKAALSLPHGASGVPNGWTTHDVL